MMNEAQRMQIFEYRRLLDELEKTYNLTDESAFNSKAALINANAAGFRVWLADADYVRGDVRIDPTDGVPYWAIHNHGVSSGQIHQPSLSSTMWTHCHGTSPETARPFIAEGHNPYMTGHYCKEGNVIARCKQDNVVHAPSVLPTAWEVV